MAVSGLTPAASSVPPAEHDDLALSPAEGRAERWATWVVVYLAALLSSLALGASAWALGLIG